MESLAKMGDEEIEIDGESHQCSALAYRRLRANMETAARNNVLFEKLNHNDEPMDARYLTWSAASFLKAAKQLGSGA